MKLKAIAAAVALLAAGAANATLTGSSAATGSSLFFEAFDMTSGVGMVQNLGQTNQSAFSMTGLSTTLDSASFAALLGTDTAGTNLKWWVLSSNQNDASYSGYNITTTISTLPSAAMNQDSSQLGTLQYQLNTHMGLLNAQSSANAFSIPSTAAAYPGLVGTNYFGSLIGADVTSPTGFGSMDFYAIANNPDDYSVVYTKLTGAAGGDGKFTLNSNGLLTFDAAVQAPAGVPLPAAAWLFGSGLLGLVGIGRRRKD